MLQATTMMGVGISLSDYDEKFPNKIPHETARQIFKKYNIKIIGFAFRYLTTLNEKNIDDNKGVIETQQVNLENQEGLQASFMSNGWDTNKFPPIIDVSRAIKNEIDGRDRLRVLKSLDQPYCPVLQIDCSHLSDGEFEKFRVEYGQAGNYTYPSKSLTFNTFVNSGLYLINLGLLGTDKESIAEYVNTNPTVLKMYPLEKQAGTKTKIINKIFKSIAPDDEINTIYDRKEIEKWLKLSIGMDYNGFYSSKNIKDFNDIVLYDPGNDRDARTFCRYILKNVTKGETTKIVLYSKNNFLSAFKHAVTTYKSGLDKLITQNIHGQLRLLDGLVDYDKAMKRLKKFNYYEIVGYVPTTDDEKTMAMWEVHRTATEQEMFGSE
tara:strand:- start:6895 stop:8031 length:1137 start_codon:yes stop_codon:yes gene_type:complete